MAFTPVIILLAAVAGGAGADTPPPSPPSILTSPQPAGFESLTLKPLAANTATILLTPHWNRQNTAQTDPRFGWLFTVACYGYFRTEHLKQPELRFRVYAQQAEDLPVVQNVCRLLLRLQEIAWIRLRLQVNLQGERVLNVWLCRQGNSGGEQWRNHLYVYSIQEIREPLEWLREVAHEFSHALIPGITGYTAPEPWANGYMGERLFMTWLEPLMQSGLLSPEDTCGTSVAEVRRFVNQRCVPLRNVWLTTGFPEKDFRRTDAGGMGTLIGLVLYIDSVYGSSMLRATFARLAEPQPIALWKAFTEAVSDSDEVQMTPLNGKAQVWLPAGTWRVETEDRRASLQQGKAIWRVAQPVWRLPRSGWYLLQSNLPVRLLRQDGSSSG